MHCGYVLYRGIMLLGKFVAGIYAVESLLQNVCSREITNQNNHYAGDRT